MQLSLIVRALGVGGGERRSGLIESIDLYPSLCEIAGRAPPEHLQGRSFAKLMKSPDAQWKSTAVGRYQNGDTICTDSFRFTEYTDAKGNPTSQMLYDHAADPDENVKVSQSEEAVTDLAGELHRMMGHDRK